MINMEMLYILDPQFKHYVDKYSDHHDIYKDKAMRHQIVIEVAKMYKERSEQNESTGSPNLGESGTDD